MKEEIKTKNIIIKIVYLSAFFQWSYILMSVK